MFTIDIPYASTQDVQTMVVALAATGQAAPPLLVPKNSVRSTTGSNNVTIEGCQDVMSLSPDSAVNSIPVLQGVLKSLGYSTKQIDSGKVPTAVREAIKVKVIEPPLHGTVTRFETPPHAYFWQYFPEVGYQGNDRVTFLVKVEGRRFKLITNLLVQRVVDEFASPPDCQKIFLPSKVTKGVASDVGPNGPVLSYSSWFAGPKDYSIVPTFGNLLNKAVGQTNGEGTSADITLDTTAAGHGWYLDNTPLDNTDDYLPTSNPNVWQAKSGSKAAVKIDMLSVLLHEYGHALGLEHSADSGDFMATTLQHGERRLPNADESYTIITGLVAQIAEALKMSNKMPPMGNTLVSNVPGPEDYLYLKGARMEEMHPISTLPPSNLLNITLFSYAGDLFFGLIATDELPHLESLGEYVGEAFTELEASVRDAHA